MIGKNNEFLLLKCMEDFLKEAFGTFFFKEEESTIFWWIFLAPEFDGYPILFTYSVDGDLIVIFFVVW